MQVIVAFVQFKTPLGISLMSLVTTIITTQTFLSMKTADAFVCRDFVDAPITAIGAKVYVTWATIKSGNWEVMFRTSNDRVVELW
jgi:hypothetical protein